jgi:hypothetical protein
MDIGIAVPCLAKEYGFLLAFTFCLKLFFLSVRFLGGGQTVVFPIIVTPRPGAGPRRDYQIPV